VTEPAADRPGTGELLVEVLLPLALPGTLTYRVPPELASRIRIGQRIIVPLGSRRATGYVAAVGGASASVDRARIRDVAAVVEDQPSLGEELIGFLLEAARYYLAPPGEALRVALPRVADQAARRVCVLRAGSAPAVGQRLGARQQVLLAALAERGELPLAEARRSLGVTAAMVRALAGRGWVVQEERAATDPFGELRGVAADEPPAPTAAQRAAIDAIVSATGSAGYRGFLLYGVTASGKTEVYLRCAAEVLRAGRACLVLVPEIALTPQLVRRFRARLGEAVGVVHSALPAAERRRTWAAMRDGRIRVAIGARSALFAPLVDLALVVVDEEHDGSFKQADRFRYHARDLAMLRARRAGAVVVLGSATPSLESYRNAHTGKLTLLRLPERATPRPLPTVRISDLRVRARCHARHPFLSLELAEALERTLARGEQSILFLNRRGFAPAAVCPACGKFVECPSCGVALAYHRIRDALLCHYCGFQRAVPPFCEACRAEALDLRGLGTERVVVAVQELFPAARVGRLDSDVAPGAASERILERLRNRELDVLVGTQMVTKGHDLPAVTLVGILRADMGLHVVDFRAAERTFQLLTQVAGRAGRGTAPGQVVLQTYLPDHYAITAAARQDFEAFVRAELPFRRELGYPPFGFLALVRGEGREEEAVRRTLETLARELGPAAEAAGAELLGPCPAPIPRLRGAYRWQLLVRGATRRAVRAVAALAAARAERLRGGLRLIVDIDPLHLS
jgi:primosomal protein N' (replication factor Y) (superfamily II helicase)